MSSGAIGLNDKPAPTVSRQVGAIDPDGNLQALLVNADGELLVTGGGSPPILQDVNLTEVGGAAIALGQTVMSDSLPVVISSDQSTLSVKGPATSFTRTVVTTTGTTPVQITAVANQIGIEVEPLGAGNVYWGPSNTISSTNAGRINQYNPLRRETSADVYICVASGASNVDCAVYQWVRA